MSLSVESFRDVLYGAAKRLGMVPEEDGLQRSEAVMMTEFFNSAMKLAWEFFPWPDAMVLSEEAVVSHPTVIAARYVPRSNNVRTLKVVTGMWKTDPRIDALACAYPLNPRGDGFYIYDAALASVWVDYRPEPPKYTSQEWSNLKAYVPASLVWDVADTGHVYRALQAVPAGTLLTSVVHWQQVPVLACLAEAVKSGIVGAWHASEGQHGTARVKEIYLLEALEHEILQIQNQGQQSHYYHC